jgi:hypothetical protein
MSPMSQCAVAVGGGLGGVQRRFLKADSHIACRAHAVPLPCREAKGLECVFPI